MAITKLESSRDFLRVWFFWKKQAVFIFLLIVGLVMFYAYTVTPQYESDAEILVLPKTNEGEVVSSGSDDNKVIPVTTNDIYTEMELISSKAVLTRTVASFGAEGTKLSNEEKSLLTIITSPFSAVFNGILRGLKLTPPPSSERDSQVSLLKDSLKIEPIVDSNVIKVGLRGENPERAKEVLDMLLQTYLQHRNIVFTKEEGLNFYDDQAKQYKKNLNQAEKALKAFQLEWNILNLDMQNQATIELMTKLNNDLELLEISYDEQNSRIIILKRTISGDTKGLYLTKEMRKISAIIELEKGIVPLLIKRSEISKSFTESSREYQSINDQVAILRDEIHQEIEKAIRTDELELESMRIKTDSLRQRIADLVTEANEFHQKDKKLQELQRRVDLYRNSYSLYINKTESAKMLQEKVKRDLANVSIASEPMLSKQPVSPNRMMMLLFSLFLGTSMAISAPFLFESIDNKLKTADDVEELLELPVICSFSDLNN